MRPITLQLRRLCAFFAAPSVATASVFLALLLGCSGESPVPTFSLLLGGDTDFGESYHQAIRARKGKSVLDHRDYDRPLAALAPLLRGSDAVVLNLETPLTKSRRSPLESRKPYVHWSDPEAAPAALRRHNVTAVSLANNHTMDHGPPGLDDTLAALQARLIEPFGAGATAAEARRAWMREVSVNGHRFRLAVLGGFEYRQRYDESHRFYARDAAPGVNELDPEAMAIDIARIRAEAPDTFVIVFPHWGESYERLGEQEQSIARGLVDAGADLIVGHGTHTVQPIERYRGRWILYGIGNFAFGAPGRFSERGEPPFGLAVRLEVRAGAQGLAPSLRAYPLLTDNTQTGYQTRPVKQDELEKLRRALRGKGAGTEVRENAVAVGQDRFGWYLELPTID